MTEEGLRRRMEAFDRLPKSIRDAINEAPLCAANIPEEALGMIQAGFPEFLVLAAVRDSLRLAAMGT